MPDIALDVQGVTAGYVPDLPILHDVSIQVVRGTVTVITLSLIHIPEPTRLASHSYSVLCFT